MFIAIGDLDKVIDRAFPSNGNFSHIGLDDRKWLNHRSFTKGNPAAQLNRGSGADHALESKTVKKRRHNLWYQISLSDAQRWLQHAVLLFIRVGG